MSLIGDTGELADRTIVVPVVHTVTGNSVSFNLSLTADASISHYMSAFASVKISGPLRFEISAPATSTVAASAIIAVCPDKYDDWPTTRAQVQRLEGAVLVKDAILVPASLVLEGRVREVSSSLKPETLVGHPPRIVGHLSVAGGTAGTVTTITVHVPLLVDGVAHFKTW
jgi:hypothetical protein